MKEIHTNHNTPATLRFAWPILLAGALSLILGCSSTPKGGEAKSKPAPPMQSGMSKEEILKQPDVKGKPATHFQQPLEKTREAALRALTFVGCEIKKQEPYFVSGRRPNKMGLFVGSGGETVKAFMYPTSDTETDVWVDTDLSFVGMAGQQGWDKQVLAEMTNLLNKNTTPQ
jgi:hypothetical protein